MATWSRVTGPTRALPLTATSRVAGRLPWMALGIVYVMWGSTYLAIRYTIDTVPPLLSAGLRFLVGGLLLTAIVVALRGPRVLRMSRAQLGTALLAGLLLPACGNGLVTLAQQHVASGLAALLIASVPIYIVLLRLVSGDRPRRTTLLGVGIGLAGLASLVLAKPAAGSGGVIGAAWWGPPLVLLAGLGWATGTYATTRLPVPPNPFVLAAVEMLAGGLALAVAGALAGERLELGRVTTSSWLAWGYLSIVVSLGAFSAYAYALGTLPVSTVATYAYVNPVIAVLLGVLIAGERFSAIQLTGGSVVLLAVVLVIAAEARRG